MTRPALEERLKKLYSLRRQQDSAYKGDAKLYNDILAEICQTIFSIKKRFPHRVDQCKLFSNIIDEKGEFNSNWAKDFSKNFYKIFIDRDQCHNEGELLHLQFNNALTYEESGSDLCYAEAYALGFLTMLLEVGEVFDQDEKSGEVSQVSENNFINFLIRFNEIVTGNKYNPTKVVTKQFGSDGNYEHALDLKEKQSKFGPSVLLYNFAKTEFFTQLSAGYKYDDAAASLYRQYLNDLRDNPQIAQRLTFKMSVDVAVLSHLCIDGNGRSTNLISWMMALMHNHDFIVAARPYLFDESVFKEGVEWTENFLQNPKTKSISPVTQQMLSGLLKFDEQKTEMPFLIYPFVQRLVADNSQVLFEIPLELERPISCGTCLTLENYLIYTTKGHVQRFKEISKINFANLVKVIEENRLDIISCESLEQRNSKIAMHFLHYVMNDDRALKEEGDLYLIEKVAEVFTPEKNSGTAEQTSEYEALWNKFKKTGIGKFSIKKSEASQLKSNVLHQLQ